MLPEVKKIVPGKHFAAPPWETLIDKIEAKEEVMAFSQARYNSDGDLELVFTGKRLPERNLAAAVLSYALLDLQANRPDNVRNEAFRFLMGTGVNAKYPDYPFSAEHCCIYIDINLAALRRKAVEYYNNPPKLDW